jgi:hypothetical protein
VSYVARLYHKARVPRSAKKKEKKSPAAAAAEISDIKPEGDEEIIMEE